MILLNVIILDIKDPEIRQVDFLTYTLFIIFVFCTPITLDLAYTPSIILYE